MTHNDRKTQLLFHINNDWVESINEIAITFPSWEPVKKAGVGKANDMSYRSREMDTLDQLNGDLPRGEWFTLQLFVPSRMLFSDGG